MTNDGHNFGAQVDLCLSMLDNAKVPEYGPGSGVQEAQAVLQRLDYHLPRRVVEAACRMRRARQYDALLPYAGSSGYARGVATSEERAVREDADGTTSRRQQQALAVLHEAGPAGLTWQELALALGLHHGQASGVLSVLHKVRKIARLTERRNRCFVYVHPDHVEGRDTQPQASNRRGNT